MIVPVSAPGPDGRSLLALRLPGSARPAVLDRPGLLRAAAAQPDVPTGAGAPPAAAAQPAAAGQLPDAVAAAAVLCAGGAAVARAPLQYGPGPDGGAAVWHPDDAVC